MITKYIEMRCRFCEKVVGRIERPDVKANKKADLDTIKLTLLSLKDNLKKNADDTTIQAALKEFRADQINKEMFNWRSDQMTLEKEIQDLPDETDEVDSTIADIRCENCEKTKGNYKEMADKATQDQIEPKAFKKMMEESGFEKTGFNKKMNEISKEKERLHKQEIEGEPKPPFASDPNNEHDFIEKKPPVKK